MVRTVVHAVCAALLAGLVLVSCGTVRSVPTLAAQDATLIVIPIEVVQKVQRDVSGFILTLNYDDKQDMRTGGSTFRFSQRYGYITDVAPGDHRMTSMIIRWEKTGQIVTQIELNIPFTAKAREVIIPYRFSLLSEEKGFYFNAYNLLPAQHTEIREEIAGYENIDNWTLP